MLWLAIGHRLQLLQVFHSQVAPIDPDADLAPQSAFTSGSASLLNPTKLVNYQRVGSSKLTEILDTALGSRLTGPCHWLIFFGSQCLTPIPPQQ